MAYLFVERQSSLTRINHSVRAHCEPDSATRPRHSRLATRHSPRPQSWPYLRRPTGTRPSLGVVRAIVYCCPLVCMTSRRETRSGDTQAEESIQFGLYARARPQTSSAERSRLGHGCKRKCKCKRGHERALRNSTLAEAAAATAGATVLADRKRCSGDGGGGAVASACDA